MKISEAVEQLNKLQKEYGDVEVVCLHNLGERAKTRLDIINGMSYYTTVENIMHRKGSERNGFEKDHILITL